MRAIYMILSVMIVSCGSNAQKFSGKFSGDQPGMSSSATLRVQGKQLKGVVYMNGQKGNITGNITDTLATGTIYDSLMHKTYSFTSSIAGNELNMFITFPELNDAIVNLTMQRITAASAAARAKLNPALVGLWRYTDIISSGSGSNFGSFSTDYFMEFKSDGTVFSWTGSSAGGSGDVSISSSGQSAVDKAEWFTEGKSLFFVDISTRKKVSTLFYAEPTRMMLHNGGTNKKIWEKVRN